MTRTWSPTLLAGLLVVGSFIASEHLSVRADVSGGDRPVLVPITPCRLTDTRPTPNTVGPRSSALGPRETLEIAVHGDNGRCTIPADAVAVSLNVTALQATNTSFLTFWPEGERPLAASLNPAPGQPPVPNAVTTSIGADGAFHVYNEAGAVQIVIDINGYFAHHDHDDRYDTSEAVDIKIEEATAGIPGAGTSYTKAEADDRYYERDAVNAEFYERGVADDRFYEGDRVLIIAADGTPAENGAAFESTLAAIVDAAADSPYLVRLGAGSYDVGDDGVALVDHVSVEGAGQRATVITGPGQANAFTDDRATLLLADEMVLSNLTVRTTGGIDTYAAGIVGTGANWLVRDVRVQVEANGATFATGFAMHGASGSFDSHGVIDGLDVDVAEGSAPAAFTRGIGSSNHYGNTTSVTILNSRIVMKTPGSAIGELAADLGDTAVLVRSTVIRMEAGGVGVALSGHDDQIFDDVDIEISGGAGPNYGMQSGGSGMRPEVHDSRIVVSGSGSAAFSTNTSTITVSNSHLEATSYGMDSTGTSSGFGGGTYRFNNTTIDAPTAFRISTSGSGTYRFEFGGGKLDSTTNVDVTNSGVGTVITTCASSWDENYIPLDPACG